MTYIRGLKHAALEFTFFGAVIDVITIVEFGPAYCRKIFGSQMFLPHGPKDSEFFMPR
jgi:hypothetical protein